MNVFCSSSIPISSTSTHKKCLMTIVPLYSRPSSARTSLISARYSGSRRTRRLAWDITPWQVLQIVMIGNPIFSARAKVRTLRASPSFWFRSWRTPAPVQAADTISSRSIPRRSITAFADTISSGVPPLATHPG